MKEEIDINRLASLSRMALSSAEKESIEKELGSILGYISQIKEVDVPPLVDTEASFRNQFREDEVKLISDETRELILEALPLRLGDHMVVQKILDINA